MTIIAMIIFEATQLAMRISTGMLLFELTDRVLTALGFDLRWLCALLGLMAVGLVTDAWCGVIGILLLGVYCVGLCWNCFFMDFPVEFSISFNSSVGVLLYWIVLGSLLAYGWAKVIDWTWQQMKRWVQAIVPQWVT